jgi:hypothetical protein
VALLAATVVLLSTLLVLRGGDDGAAPAPGPTTTVTPTTSTTSTTTEPPTATSAPTLSSDETRAIVWPAPGTVQYDDPVEAATGMATGLVGFTSPVVGTYQPGDARSGEVPIRAKATGAVTTVLVRQLSDGHWYAIGAHTGDLRLDSPNAGAEVHSPLAVSGRSRAFEATIIVSVHAQADPKPLVRKPLMGGSSDLGPFTGTLNFASPNAAGPGAIVITTDSAEDGRIWQATVVPVWLTS